jgi:hypothetical protein
LAKSWKIIRRTIDAGMARPYEYKPEIRKVSSSKDLRRKSVLFTEPEIGLGLGLGRDAGIAGSELCSRRRYRLDL